MTATMLVDVTIRAVAAALLHSLWQGALVATVTAVLWWVLRRSRPTARYALGCVALALMVGAWAATAWRTAVQLIPEAPARTGLALPPPALGPAGLFDSSPAIRTISPAELEDGRVPLARRLDVWSIRLVPLWLAGVFGLSFRLALSWWLVQRMRRAAHTPVASFVADRVAAVAARLRVSRAVRVLQSRAVQVPAVIGWLRPVILLPASALTGLSLPQLDAILAHELAHVRRRDALARVVQVVAGAVFFFWPVVRLVSRRLDLAREAACDAWALEASEVPRPAYARLLVRMAQLRAADAASLAAPRGLDARVAAVLGPPARTRLGIAHRLVLAGWIALALGGARTAAAGGVHTVCKYTPQFAEALRQAHPEADRDGDGVLSRDEACEFQAELRRRVETPAGSPGTEPVSRLDAIDESLLTETLCCNCDRGAENSAPWIDKRSDACQSDEGVSR